MTTTTKLDTITLRRDALPELATTIIRDIAESGSWSGHDISRITAAIIAAGVEPRCNPPFHVRAGTADEGAVCECGEIVSSAPLPASAGTEERVDKWSAPVPPTEPEREGPVCRDCGIALVRPDERDSLDNRCRECKSAPPVAPATEPPPSPAPDVLAVRCIGTHLRPPCEESAAIPLTREEYDAQIAKQGRPWECPCCGGLAIWHDGAESELGVTSDASPAAPPVSEGEGLPYGAPRWIVVRKREIAPVEVYPFEDETSALAFWDRAQIQWSETYLCQVVNPRRRAASTLDPQALAEEIADAFGEKGYIPEDAPDYNHKIGTAMVRAIIERAAGRRA